jgi:hypothetical protein
MITGRAKTKYLENILPLCHFVTTISHGLTSSPYSLLLDSRIPQIKTVQIQSVGTYVRTFQHCETIQKTHQSIFWDVNAVKLVVGGPIFNDYTVLYCFTPEYGTDVFSRNVGNQPLTSLRFINIPKDRRPLHHGGNHKSRMAQKTSIFTLGLYFKYRPFKRLREMATDAVIKKTH